MVIGDVDQVYLNYFWTLAVNTVMESKNRLRPNVPTTPLVAGPRGRAHIFKYPTKKDLYFWIKTRNG